MNIVMVESGKRGLGAGIVSGVGAYYDHDLLLAVL